MVEAGVRGLLVAPPKIIHHLDAETRLFLRDLRASWSIFHSRGDRYQTRQAGLRMIGASGLHLYAFWNSGMFPTTPLTRNFPGECSLTPAIMRANSGRSFSH